MTTTYTDKHGDIRYLADVTYMDHAGTIRDLNGDVGALVHSATVFPPLPRWKYADVSCPEPADNGPAFVAPAIAAADLVSREESNR